MSADRAPLEQALEHGEEEGGHVEFKERLSREIHLADGRMESLAAQLRHRVLSGDGEATYVVGVTDDGGIAGVHPDVFSESMDVLSLLAEEAGLVLAASDASVSAVSSFCASSSPLGGAVYMMPRLSLRYVILSKAVADSG